MRSPIPPHPTPPRLDHRPLNRILVAQRITAPQMWVGGIVALQHVAACHFFINTLGAGLLGAAWATCWSNLLAALLLASYVGAAGLAGRVWANPGGWGAVLQVREQGPAQAQRPAWCRSAASQCVLLLPRCRLLLFRPACTARAQPA